MRHIQNLPAVVNSDLIVLETLGTHSKTYEFGFTELNFTLCLDKDLDAQGNARSNYYIVQSLRDEDSFSRSGQQYECNYIFSKQNDQLLYDTLNDVWSIFWNFCLHSKRRPHTYFLHTK